MQWTMGIRRGLPVIAVLAMTPPAHAQTYDPLRVTAGGRPDRLDLEVMDGARDRTIPVAIYLPAASGPAPVVLFSHGLGGSRDNNRYLAEHWAARGYVCVFLQHPGSDESVWRDVPPLRRMTALKRAASARSFTDRVRDVPAVLDQLERWNRSGPLAGRMDLAHIGMTGHSFGALTTQAVSGQSFGRRSFTDPRIDAALPMSPSRPRTGDVRAAFADVTIPWMVMTGTEDTSPINDTDVADRLAVFPALPPGSKYQLVLDGAQHSAFGDRALPGDRGARNPNHHRAILALSTAFLDAYLRGDREARAWLDGPAVYGVLERGDAFGRR